MEKRFLRRHMYGLQGRKDWRRGNGILRSFVGRSWDGGRGRVWSLRRVTRLLQGDGVRGMERLLEVQFRIILAKDKGDRSDGYQVHMKEYRRHHEHHGLSHHTSKHVSTRL